MPISRDQTLHTLLERFALEPPPAASAGDRESRHGDHPLGASDEAHLGVAVSDEALDVELFLPEPADPVVLQPAPTNAEAPAQTAAYPAPESTPTVSLREEPGPESPQAAPQVFATPVAHAVASLPPEPFKAAPAGHAAVPHSAEAAASQQRTTMPATAGQDRERLDTPEAVRLERDHSSESAGGGHAMPGETSTGSGVEPIDPAALDEGHEVEAAA
jgi:hypothetical protein